MQYALNTVILSNQAKRDACTLQLESPPIEPTAATRTRAGVNPLTAAAGVAEGLFLITTGNPARTLTRRVRRKKAANGVGVTMIIGRSQPKALTGGTMCKV